MEKVKMKNKKHNNIKYTVEEKSKIKNISGIKEKLWKIDNQMYKKMKDNKDNTHRHGGNINKEKERCWLQYIFF